MATKSSIHIKPCNIASSEAHNRRTAEYMRNIGKSKIYIVSELSVDNEQWINPSFGTPDLRTHYDNIKCMVKEKTGRAMQEKERERKGKNGKIIKVAGCSPIREGVLLVRPDTTLADVRKFGEECKQRWGITPLQIFLHKDEGHWLSGQPEAEDRESFQIAGKWFKPNYHAHIVFDWMNHETGKSQKLNDEDMATMQTLASNILLMERGQAKAVTGKEHLERNDFIIKKQKAELQRIEETQRHKEQQVTLAEQELKQVKSEIRTNWKIQCKLPPKTKRFCPLKTFNNAPLKSLDRWGYYYFSLFPSVCSHFTDTFSCQLNPVRRMYNTIHNGICYCRVSDCIIPIVRWQLRGDDDGLAPMSVLYYIEQDGSFLGIKVHKEEVIQYEQRAPFDSLEFRFQCAFYFCHLKRTHKFRSIRIICPYALLAGFIPHCCGKEALPGTG